MTKRSVEQWQALFKQHDESGLKSSEFCRVNNVCSKYFSKRRKDLNWQSIQKSKSKLIKLLRPNPADGELTSSITIKTKDIAIIIPSTHSSQWIAELVKAISV